jgi:hypothetical protein
MLCQDSWPGEGASGSKLQSTRKKAASTAHGEERGTADVLSFVAGMLPKSEVVMMVAFSDAGFFSGTGHLRSVLCCDTY